MISRKYQSKNSPIFDHLASPILQVTDDYLFASISNHLVNETQVGELKNDLDGLESVVEPVIDKIVKKELEKN